MKVLSPTSWAQALTMKAENPDALPVRGGTDVMVELNFDRKRPTALLDLGRVDEIDVWHADQQTVRIGSGVTYQRIIDELSARVPALALASRTVGSPQIRNRGTVGGNLGSASPAGDAHPPLLATGAQVQMESVRGARSVAIEEFFTGPKRSVLAPDELIASVSMPIAAGPQRFAKVGTRNAMVIAVCSLAVAVDVTRRVVGTGIGSAGPTPLHATEAEAFLADALPWDSSSTLDDEIAVRFGQLVGEAARPINDVRGTAAYRRHALTVLATRAIRSCWKEVHQ